MSCKVNRLISFKRFQKWLIALIMVQTLFSPHRPCLHLRHSCVSGVVNSLCSPVVPGLIPANSFFHCQLHVFLRFCPPFSLLCHPSLLPPFHLPQQLKCTHLKGPHYKFFLNLAAFLTQSLILLL